MAYKTWLDRWGWLIFVAAFVALGASGVDPLGIVIVIGVPLLILYGLVKFVKWAWCK